MISAQVGSYLLDQTNGVYLSQLDVDSSAPLAPQIFSAANRDGAKLIAAYYAVKQITVKGRITGADFPTLNAAIDGLKNALMGVNLNLDINDGTTCKRYIVTPTADLQIPRDRTMITFADFSITYSVIDPPYGIDAVQGGAINNFTALSNSNVTVNLFTSALNFSGSAQPGAKITITLTNPGDLYALDIVDVSNSRSMNVSYSFQANDVLVVDLVNYTVQVNGIDVNYTGQLPNWQAVAGQQIGINGYTVSGVNLDQTSVATGAPTAINGTKLFYSTAQKIAQSFVPAYSAPVSQVSLILNKVGSPTGNVVVSIQADSSGVPSGTSLVSYSIPASAITSLFQYIPANFSIQPPLTATSTYWIVVSNDTAGDVNNYFQIRTISPSTYAAGNLKTYNGSAWSAVVAGLCLAFKEFRSVAGQQNPTTDYTSNDYVENFSTTTKKDASNTGANWNTSGPYLTQTGAPASATDTFAGDSAYNFLQVYGTGGLYAVASPFVASHTGTLQTVTLQMSRGTASSTYATVQISASVGAGFSYIGTADSHLQQSTLTNTPAPVTFTVNAPVTAGTTYYVVVIYPDNAGTLSSQLRTQGSDNAGTTVTYYKSDGTVNSSNSGTAFNTVFTIQYTGYSGLEQAQSLDVANTQAEVLSISQVTTTILFSGATFQGQASVDGGGTWLNLPRDINPFDTDNIPAISGTGLRMRWLLQNAVTPTVPAYVTSTNLYFKKGISLDATTKYGSQSFTPTANGSIASLQLFLAKVGSPGAITVQIQSDSSGSPSGSPIPNGSTTISAASVASSFGWVTASLATAASITSGTKYWIVVYAASVSNANRYLVLANNDLYSTGALKKSTNSGSTWAGLTSLETLLFRTYGSGGGNYNLNLQVTYNKRYL